MAEAGVGFVGFSCQTFFAIFFKLSSSASQTIANKCKTMLNLWVSLWDIFMVRGSLAVSGSLIGFVLLFHTIFCPPFCMLCAF